MRGRSCINLPKLHLFFFAKLLDEGVEKPLMTSLKEIHTYMNIIVSYCDIIIYGGVLLSAL